MIKGLMFFLVALGSFTASAMPILTCNGSIPVWSLRERRPQRMNPQGGEFVVDSRRDAQVVLGDDPARPWVTVHMTTPLAYATTKANYTSFMILKIQSDKKTHFRVSGSGIYEPFEVRLSCVPSDDGRG